MNILLTNDDSHDSPLFHLAIEHLAPHGDLRIVVPKEEQSWKGKSMTRFDPVYVDEIHLHGHPAYCVTGTPADCVSLGIHNLYDTEPDLVVSGINIGINTGLGFLFASGTVGACLEANISRIPAIALSQHLSVEEFMTWNKERRFEAAMVDELSRGIGSGLPAVWDALGDRLLEGSTTWNVNFPIHSEDAELRWTRLGETYYRRVFSKEGDRYRHRLGEFVTDPDASSDEQTVRAGFISVSPIDIRNMRNGAFTDNG